MKTTIPMPLVMCTGFALCTVVSAIEPVWKDSLGWIPLKGLKPVRAQGNKWFTKSASLKKTIDVVGKHYEHNQYIAADANGEITYSLPLGAKFTEFRALVGLRFGGTKGSVIFKVRADDKIVFTSELISHKKGNTQRIAVAFPPATSITLITDPNGDDQEDWSVWLEPQIKSGTK